MPSDLFPADWLLYVPREPGTYEDTTLGSLKSGKESVVELVARRAGAERWLLARKRFVAPERRLFRDTYQYVGRWGTGNSVEARAMKKNTRFGQEVRHRRWIVGEWESIRHMYAADLTVPPPVELNDDGYTMAFVGDGEVAAPRLASVALEADVARRVWDQLLEELRLMLAAERVHGDLSAYNVLWWRERPVFIDFSQTVEIVTHPAAYDLIKRDVTALASYFVRRGVPIDVPEALSRIGADARLFAAQMMPTPPPPRG